MSYSHFGVIMDLKLSMKLTTTFEESKNKFDNLNSGEDVANFLEVPLKYLTYLLYQDRRKHYQIFEIPKKSAGTRQIKKPIKSIDLLQRKLLPFLQEKYRVKMPVHGFVKNKSVLSNAKQHLKKKYILNLDLKNFYGSINFGRVRGLFMSKPFNMGDRAATIIAQICCDNNSLPQGACTSPIISNFIMSKLDKELIQFAKNTHTTYTRYADDITFSSKKIFSNKCIVYNRNGNPILEGFLLSDVLKDLINSCGFEINFNKVRLENKIVRQEVTGITVNDFPNVRRTYIRQIRAMLHSWDKDGLDNAAKKHLEFKSKKLHYTIKDKSSYFKNVLIGKLAFVKMVRGNDDIILIKLCLKFSKLYGTDEALPNFIKEIKMRSEEFEVFICHASEDKDKIARPLFDALEKNGIKSFLDEKYITWGDSLTEKINYALGKSKYVIAVLTENSIAKSWPLKEINSTLAREISSGKVLLPIIYGSEEIIFKELPLLKDKLYKIWKDNPEELAKIIGEMLKKN